MSGRGDRPSFSLRSTDPLRAPGPPRRWRRISGRAGDLTSDAILPPDLTAEARVVARASGRVAGLAARAFRLPAARFHPDSRACRRRRGRRGRERCSPASRGRRARSCSAERTALNLLGRLCGIATATRDYAGAVARHGAHIVCTRKTTPGLRALEKYAVRCGGGHNHRFGLDDAVLIKDNHVALPAASVPRSSAPAARRPPGEDRDRGGLPGSASRGPRCGRGRGAPRQHVSGDAARGGGNGQGEGDHGSLGGINPKTAAGIAATGVNFLSMGWLTHSAPSLDVALDVG